MRPVKPEDLANLRWTEQEIEALRNAAKNQAAGDDSGIDFSDIPRLTSEQLALMVRLRPKDRIGPTNRKADLI